MKGRDGSGASLKYNYFVSTFPTHWEIQDGTTDTILGGGGGVVDRWG